MKISFFGLQSAFDYYQIGGTESFIRRLALQLIREGETIDYVLVGSSQTKTMTLKGGKLKLRYFASFRQALSAMADSYDHIVTVYLPPIERLAYSLFRFQYRGRTSFHIILFGLPESPLKRMLALVDAKLFYSRVFAISPRIHRAAQSWSLDSVLLLPPVPQDYFLSLRDKVSEAKIRVTFVGRVDKGKGIDWVIPLFLKLKDNPNVETLIYGLYHPHYLSEDIHEWLKGQTEIRYDYVDHRSYSPEIEDRLKAVLKDTDILILPYKKLSSSIDVPLLLLEGMASLCAIITRPLGDISLIYGDSNFLIPDVSDADHMLALINDISSRLAPERERILKQNRKLKFGVQDIARLFRSSL